MTTKNAFFGLIFFWRCAIYSWQFPSLHPWLCFRQSTAKNMKFKHLHVTTFLEILLHQVAIYWFFYILSIMISEVILFQGAIKPLNIRDIFFLNIGLGMLFVMNSNKKPAFNLFSADWGIYNFVKSLTTVICRKLLGANISFYTVFHCIRNHEQFATVSLKSTNFKVIYSVVLVYCHSFDCMA